jgi:hypothetical protein
MTAGTSVSFSSQLIRAWALEQGLEPPGPGAESHLTVTLDRVRLHLIAASPDKVLIETRVADLPLPPLERDRLIERALTLATARLRDGVGGLASRDDGQSLWLQAELGPQAGLLALSESVEQMANEADLWRGAL